MAKASLVVPVYNVESYVVECLKSAMDQSERDIEIIVINDGSTDTSLELVESLALEDDRVRVFSQENAGLSAARNAGIRQATAPVVMFLDSDDRLEPNAVERVLQEFALHNNDIVTFGAYCFPEERATQWVKDCLSPEYDYLTDDSIWMLYRWDARPFVWRSAFSRSFLLENDLWFNSHLPYGEDQLFYFEAYPLSKSTSLIPDKLYDYRVGRTGSLMSNASQELADKIGCHIIIAQAILEAWNRRGWLGSRDSAFMFEWVLEFLYPDIFMLKGETRSKLIVSSLEVLASYVAAIPLEEMELGSRQLLSALQADPTMGNLKAQAVIWRYYRHRKGLVHCAKRLLGRYKDF